MWMIVPVELQMIGVVSGKLVKTCVMRPVYFTFLCLLPLFRLVGRHRREVFFDCLSCFW
jgi:hypothetical protein